MKKIIKSIKNNYIYIFLTFVILVVTYANFLGPWIVEQDSLLTNLLFLNKNLLVSFKQAVLIVLSQGRPNFFGIFWAYLTFLIDNFIYFKGIFYIIITLNFFLFAYLIIKILRLKKVFIYLPIVLCLSFLQNSWHPNGVVVFTNNFIGSLLLLFFSLISYVKYLECKRKRYILLSCVSYTCTLFTYEIFILYFPIYILLAIADTKFDLNFKVLFNKTKYLILIIIFYLITYLLIRYFTPFNYVGVTISKKLDISAILKTIWQFSISSLPMYMFYFDNWAINMNIFNNSMFLKGLLFDFQPIWILKFIAVFFLILYILKKTSYKFSLKHYFINLLIGLFYFFLPPLLLSLTSHYQNIVKNHIFLSEPVTVFSFFAFIFIITNLILLLCDYIPYKVIKELFIIFLACGIGLVGIVVDFSNYSYSKSQQLSRYKWETLNRFITTNTFNKLPNNVTILSPTLFDSIGTVVITDNNYWSNYIYLKTNKKVHIVKKLEKNKKADAYYLRYIQQSKDIEQFITFSKIEDINDTNNLVYSKNITIYNLSKYNNFSIFVELDNLLKKKCQITDITLGGNKLKNINEGFVGFISGSDFIIENDLKRIDITSNNDCVNISNDKIYVLPGYSRPPIYN